MGQHQSEDYEGLAWFAVFVVACLLVLLISVAIVLSWGVG